MNHAISRRDVLRTGMGAVVGSVVAGLAGGLAVPSVEAQSATASGATAFVTDLTGRRHARFDDVLNPAAGASGAAAVTVDARAPLQSILGFGAAFTEAACTMLSRLDPHQRGALFDELFSPGRSNFSIGRLCTGASDYSTIVYSYDDGGPDPTLSRFSIEHDRLAVLPMLRQARATRPDLYLFASPWSPPGWMKYSNSMCGGSIHPQNSEVYAHYILKYLQAYAAAGVKIDAITPQNEIDADQEGRMPACTWPAEVEQRYIAEHLGPLLAQSEVRPQIWMLDHNYDLVGRVLDQLAHEQYRKYINAVAWHGYVGSPEQMKAVQQRYPDLDMHWTEGGDAISSKTLLTAWDTWGQTFAGILNNGVRSITTWNLALDENGKPNTGPFDCAGLVTIDSKSHAITRNGIFWALSHYARAMPRESRVLRCSTSGESAVAVAAARQPSGAVAVVLSNPGPATPVRLNVLGGGGRDQSQPLSLSANSVTTVLLPS